MWHRAPKSVHSATLIPTLRRRPARVTWPVKPEWPVRGGGYEPWRDRDVMTGGDAGGMRKAVLRPLVATAVVAGLVSGCTGAPAGSAGRAAQSLAGLRDVRPCPRIAGS